MRITLRYLKVSGVTNGVYRLYEGSSNVNHTDSQWCEYLTNSYPSGTTGTTHLVIMK